MSEFESIERDLREYLEKEPNLRRADRLSYLTAIFHRYMEFNKLDHVVNSSDYTSILGHAKKYYVGLKFPVRISRKELEQNDALHICTFEAFINYLNKNNLLRKLVKFDYTE
jgi:CMP-N-acetylneuraminic acid synthetase